MLIGPRGYELFLGPRGVEIALNTRYPGCGRYIGEFCGVLGFCQDNNAYGSVVARVILVAISDPAWCGSLGVGAS